MFVSSHQTTKFCANLYLNEDNGIDNCKRIIVSYVVCQCPVKFSIDKQRNLPEFKFRFLNLLSKRILRNVFNMILKYEYCTRSFIKTRFWVFN